MPIQNSPYDAFSKLLSTSGHPCSPAELHGVLLGRSCTGVGFDADNWLADVAELLEKEPEDNVRNALIGLQEMVKGELTGDDVTVVLLLPTDDAPLAERAAALGANAVVGIDLDYEVVGPNGGMLMVSISGTAVVI